MMEKNLEFDKNHTEIEKIQMKSFKHCCLTLIISVFTLSLFGCEKMHDDASTTGIDVNEKSVNDKAATNNSGDEASSEYTVAPEYQKIFAVSSSGKGIVHNFFMVDGRVLSGTAGNHDSQLIDSTDMPEDEAISAINNALQQNLPVILEGSDTKETSDKVSRIMRASVGFSVDGGIAYEIINLPDGSRKVAPLKTVVNEKGERTFDQLNTLTQVINN